MANRFRHLIAKYSPRPLQSAAYNILYYSLYKIYTLNPMEFKDKRVLIIGSADSVYDDLKKLDADDFDIIVKMNNGLYAELDFDKNNPFRCDVIFHSHRANTKPITAAALKAAQVKTIVHRTMKKRAFLSTLMLERTFGALAKVRIIPVDRYHLLKKRLGRSPTTGLICADFFLNAPVSHLALVGFTFFTTPYMSGYDDSVTTDEIARSRVGDVDYHAPQREAHLMQNLVENARSVHKSIYVSESMEAAMNMVASKY